MCLNWYIGFSTWTPRYNWNIVENDFRHQNTHHNYLFISQLGHFVPCVSNYYLVPNNFTINGKSLICFLFQHILILEVVWPVLIFIIVALMRSAIPPENKPTCKYILSFQWLYLLANIAKQLHTQFGFITNQD